MNVLPLNLYTPEVNSLINRESERLKQARVLILQRFGMETNDIVRTDLNCVAIPEILSAQYCIISGNNHLLKISPPLQAYLAYAISIYDTVSDQHYFNKEGEPTFLTKYGLKFLLKTEELYKNIINRLSNELEAYIEGAVGIAQKMYLGTIEGDKLRNNGIVSPHEAISLQDKLAGEHAYNIAVLSKAEELGTFSRCLVNAITTLEDVVDLFRGEDFTGKKTTIPISFLVDEFGCLIKDHDTIKKSLSIKRTREYVTEQINLAKRILDDNPSRHKTLLEKMIRDINNFNEEFLEKYL